MARTQTRARAEELDALIHIWECGDDLSPPRRGLLLLGAALPDTDPAELAELPIGRRDTALLDLGDRLFGADIACIAACPACGERIDLAFASDAIRAEAGTPGAIVTADAEGMRFRVRLPTSTDLIAIETETDLDRAEHRLLARCLGDEAAAGGLSDAAREAIGEALSAADAQAEIVLDLACPGCAARAQVPFDAVSYLWGRLDHWAKAMLAAIDAIAGRYGWSEDAILALSPRRRQSYLDRIAGVAR
ncbi:hypothetical protein E5A73_16285 [Sphingomonas gei]|uniref:Phage baseplate protein n=1 Tax=Sphingomonas gei TaxID=1395960 RepID=A0A4S1X8A9_9SPHN|nr:hypothetical protein [Sphingomonas gei]TGX52351.1 hypothetical protein E5A73_16285 [Sphingomonas gei]